MKRILLLCLISLSVCCCTKEPAIEPKLELQVNEIKETSVNVTTTVEPGSYTIISQGVCYSKNTNPTINDLKVIGTGSISIAELNPGVKYYAKAYATTAKETFYSTVVEFTTTDIVVTAEISDIEYRSAKIAIKVSQEVSSITEKGMVYSEKNQTPTISDNKLVGEAQSLTLLDYEATYYLRGYVVISGRIVYSATSEFTTKTLERVADYDGNEYRVIELASKIGPRKWLLDNFKGTHYANGDPIPHVTDNNEWISLSTGAYCYYDNDKKNAETYGALYNWWAAVDPRGLIVGWHTPSDLEWNEMSQILPYEVFGIDTRGQKLKEAGTKHWQAPNEGANNQSGFTALPGGSRAHEDGKFYYLKTRTYFQCTTEIGNSFWTRILFFDQNKLDDGMGIKKSSGVSIRLIKNN